MTDEEANSLSMCGYGCGVIGGPWISDNPDCPVCNAPPDNWIAVGTYNALHDSTAVVEDGDSRFYLEVDVPDSGEWEVKVQRKGD